MLKIILLLILGLLFSPHPVQADWPVDTTPPYCSITNNLLSTSFTVGDSVTVSVSNSPLDPSGIKSIILYRNGSQVGTSATSPLTYGWNTATFSPGSYSFSANLIDGVGNPSTASTCPSVTYTLNISGSAWIKTSGDVHSNTRINAPGGPRD